MKALICFILCLFHFSLSATIIETKSFKEVPSFVTEDTLVLLDIDDTLLIPVQMLGCDEWFKHRLELHLKNGMTFSHALDLALAEWEAIRHITEMEIVEPGSEDIVRDMQKKGVKMLGLTTQGIALSYRTVKQLQSHHINFLDSSPFKEPFYFEEKDQGVLYRKGILFTSGTAKGEALFKLCDHHNFRPKRIVFVNDKDTHLKDVEESAEKRGVEFIGLRYGYSDGRKASFDPHLADIQFKNSGFHGIINDDHALEKKIEAFLLSEAQE
jgi:hypothetical protein